MSTLEITHPAAEIGFTSLTQDANGYSISSYISGTFSPSIKQVMLEQALDVARKGGGLIVDLHSALTSELLDQLPEIAAKYGRKIYHIDLTKKCNQSAFHYDPFYGKDQTQSIVIAQAFLKARTGLQKHKQFTEFADLLVSRLITAHFVFHDSLSLEQFCNYVRYDKLPILHARLQERFAVEKTEELHDLLTTFRPYFYENGETVDFKRHKYIQDLNGLSGSIAILGFDFGGLLELSADAEKQRLDLAQAIAQGDYIIYDYGYSIDPEIKLCLAAIMRTDLDLAFHAPRTSQSIHFAVFTNYRSWLSNATMKSILETSRRTNLSLVPWFESHDRALDDSLFLLYPIICNVRYQLYFAGGFSETGVSALTEQQLEICNRMGNGEYLLISQGVQSFHQV